MLLMHLMRLKRRLKLDKACWDCFLGAHFRLLDGFVTPSWRVAPGLFDDSRLVALIFELPTTLPSHYKPQA